MEQALTFAIGIGIGLYIMGWALCSGFCWHMAQEDKGWYMMVALCWLWPVMVPLLLCVAGLILWPWEWGEALARKLFD